MTHFAPELHIPNGTTSIDFYTKFGATEHFVLRNDDGSVDLTTLYGTVNRTIVELKC